MDALAATGAGTAAVGAGAAPGAGRTPGMTPAAGAEADPGTADAATGAAGRSSTLVPAPAPEVVRVDIKASSSVQMKKTVAQAAVDRERKLALPVAPNKLPDAPLPKEAPMSAPLPCCTSTRPIMASAESNCTVRSRVIQICMMKGVSK